MNVTAGGPEALAWLRERAGCALTPNARCIQAVDGAGRIRGVVGFDHWTHNAVQAHWALDTPVAWRALWGPALAYPFQESGLGLVLGVIPADNARSVTLARRMGFTEAHRVLDGWARGVDLLILELRPETASWPPGTQGR